MPLLLVIVVVAVAALGRRAAGRVAAINAAFWFDFLPPQPHQRLTIAKSSDITTAVLLLAVGLAVSQLAARARRFQVLAITDARIPSGGTRTPGHRRSAARRDSLRPPAPGLDTDQQPAAVFPAEESPQSAT